MIYMRADSAKSITFLAQVNPVGKVDPDIENTLEWSVTRIKSADDDTAVSDTTIIGTGTRVVYTPSRGGDFLINAKIPGYAAVQTVQIHVEYGNYYVGEVRVTLADEAHKNASEAPSSATLYSTETTRFALTGVQYLNPDVETKWYVNGEYAASGKTFDFTPKKAGTYYITGSLRRRGYGGLSIQIHRKRKIFRYAPARFVDAYRRIGDCGGGCNDDYRYSGAPRKNRKSRLRRKIRKTSDKIRF